MKSRSASEARPHVLAGFRVSADLQLPPRLSAWVEAEQRTIHRQVDRNLLDPGTDGGLDFQWKPESGERFIFPSAWVSAARAIGAVPPRFRRRRLGKQEWLYVWHPTQAPRVASLLRASEPGPDFFGAVTSSSRTVLLWPVEGRDVPFFAKLSLPLTLAGEPRALDAHHVRHAVDATTLLGSARRGFRYLPEPCGFVPDEFPDAAWVLRPAPPGRWRPFFSFTGPNCRPQLGRWLIKKLVHCWLHAAIDEGFSLEAHAQNVLVEVNRLGKPTGRFGFRDLNGLVAEPQFLARRRPELRATVDRLLARRSPAFDDPDESLATSFHRFLLGGPAAGVPGGQTVALETLTEVLGVDASSPDEVIAEIHGRRARLLRPPRPPRWLSRFLEREQGVNDRQRDPRFFAPVIHDALPQSYDPSRHPVWPLDALELAKSEVELLPATARRSVQRRGARFLLFVHPFMRTRLGLLGVLSPPKRTPFFAAPTSSPRSLAVWDARGRVFGLKVSLDVELLTLTRLIHGSRLRRAVAVDRCVESISPRDRTSYGLTLLREPESLRVIERDDGQILRRLDPVLGDALAGFGLFAVGARLESLPEPQLLTVLQRIFKSLARAEAYLFFQQGLIGQLHQQNVLFVLDRNGLPNGRLVLRDLDSFVIDQRVRKARRRTMKATDWGNDASTAHRYDDAWARSCRADFGFLADRLLRRRRFGSAQRANLVWKSLDVAFLTETIEHLGEPVVQQELKWVLERSLGGRLEGTLQAPVVEALHTLPPAALTLGPDLKAVGYSVNAMVHAWLKQL